MSIFAEGPPPTRGNAPSCAGERIAEYRVEKAECPVYGAEAMTSKRRFGRALGLLGFVGVFAAYGQASAQQSTFKLDRLEVPGAPDDGVAVFRPVTNLSLIHI